MARNAWERPIVDQHLSAEHLRPRPDPAAQVGSLARGLAVIEAFHNRRGGMTLAECARATKLDRAVARRMLHTLQALGYVTCNGRLFALAPRVLSLAAAFLSSSTLSGRIRPLLEEASATLGESCSAAVLERDDILYIARAAAPAGPLRILSMDLGPGTRLPAHVTSMGRILLGALPPIAFEDYLARLPPEGVGEPPAPSAASLRAAVIRAQEQGHAMVDGELTPGLRCVAVPVFGAGGELVAAIAASAYAARADAGEMEARFVPILRDIANRAGVALAS
jgi:IclR family pca regulon transcriptional regulator